MKPDVVTLSFETEVTTRNDDGTISITRNVSSDLLLLDFVKEIEKIDWKNLTAVHIEGKIIQIQATRYIDSIHLTGKIKKGKHEKKDK